MRARLELLNKDELELIHNGTLEVMEKTGILVDSADARNLLKKSGCTVDEKTKMVKFPANLVESAIKTSPNEFTQHSRNGEFDLKMVSDGSLVHYQTFGVGTRMTDYVSPGNYNMRNSTLEDLKNICTVTEACDGIDWFCSPVSAMDLAGKAVSRNVREFDAILSSSSKPVMLDPVAENMIDYFDIMKICYGGDEEMALKKPFIAPVMCPASPLQLDKCLCDVVLEAVKYSMPLSILSMAMSSATSPVFSAGSLVTHNAEVLAGITLAQVANPGNPMYYSSSTTAFDPRTGTAPVGSPELGVLSAAVAQLSQYYKIPTIVAGT